MLIRTHGTAGVCPRGRAASSGPQGSLLCNDSFTSRGWWRWGATSCWQAGPTNTAEHQWHPSHCLRWLLQNTQSQVEDDHALASGQKYTGGCLLLKVQIGTDYSLPLQLWLCAQHASMQTQLHICHRFFTNLALRSALSCFVRTYNVALHLAIALTACKMIKITSGL